MPSTFHSTTTRIQSEDGGPILTLKVTHHVDIGQPTGNPLGLKSSPQSFTVTHGGTVKISLQGKLGIPIPTDTLQKCGGALELMRALTENKFVICLESISNFYEEDGALTLSPAGPLADTIVDSALLQLNLTGISIEFIWSTKRLNDPGSEGFADPFSSGAILLPFRRQWDIAIRKVLTTHMLRRYPYIFGTWKARLSAQNQLYRNVSNSLCQIYLRSASRELKKTGKQLFQRLLDRTESRCDASWNRLLSLQTSSGETVCSQEELDRWRSLTQDDCSDEDLDREERFKQVIGSSLAALYTASVRLGKKDFELETAHTVTSETETLEGAFAEETDKNDGRRLTPVLDDDAPSNGTVLDETGLDEQTREGTPVSLIGDAEDRPFSSFSFYGPDPEADDFTRWYEGAGRERLKQANRETSPEDLLLDFETQSHEAYEGSGSPRDVGGAPEASRSSPLAADVTISPDLLFDDPRSSPDWLNVHQSEAYRTTSDVNEDIDMLDITSPLSMTLDGSTSLPSPSTNPEGHAACLEDDMLLLSPDTDPDAEHLHHLDAEML
ncbi:hypothetical protein FRB90_012108 [Tulasnella sp. 427]|nr:hypothetical protein FRB90_012108 [Tulasnella sp. 427]